MKRLDFALASRKNKFIKGKNLRHAKLSIKRKLKKSKQDGEEED